MTDKENRIHVPRSVKPIENLEFLKSPFIISRSTYVVLSLFSNEMIVSNFSFGKNQLSTETLPYLKKAKEGCNDLFNQYGYNAAIDDPRSREASSHAFVTLASIPDFLSEKSKKYTFSRKGMFRAPETKEEYLARIQEIEAEITKILYDQTLPDNTNELNFPLMRTYVFFKVGGQIPIKVTGEDKVALAKLEALKKDMGFIDRITEDIDFSMLD